MSFRLGAVISHPIQHYSPVFRALARVPGLRVRAFYAFDHAVRESWDAGFATRFAWDVPLLDGYEHEFLRPGRSPARFGFRQVDSPALPVRLDAWRPHALWLHGYGHRLSWRALGWARGRAASLLFGDSELRGRRPLAVRAAKQVLVRAFFARCDAFLTIGDANEAYYRHYGVPPERLFRGACPVDVARFRAALAAAGSGARRRARKRHDIPEDAFVLLMLGKLIDRKRPLDLVEAIARLEHTRRGPVWALFAGDGPLRGALLARARSAGCAGRVRVTGFVNQRALPALLPAADALAVASAFDPHPLAVSEGLVAGLPVVISDRAGCVGPTDTARPEENAIVYPCGDVTALAGAVRRLADDAPLCRRMARASLALADGQDVSRMVDAVLRALRHLAPRYQDAWQGAVPPEPPLPARPAARAGGAEAKA